MSVAGRDDVRLVVVPDALEPVAEPLVVPNALDTVDDPEAPERHRVADRTAKPLIPPLTSVARTTAVTG